MMRRPLAVMLLMLAVPLMGSDCSVAVRVGGPPLPPPDGSDPPPDDGGGGGVIIVTSGASSESSRAAGAEAVYLDRALVASALAASAWTPPDFETVAERSRIVDPSGAMLGESPLSGESKPASIPSAHEKVSALAAPMPEPTGSLLFASGMGLIAGVLGRNSARG